MQSGALLCCGRIGWLLHACLLLVPCTAQQHAAIPLCSAHLAAAACKLSAARRPAGTRPAPPAQLPPSSWGLSPALRPLPAAAPDTAWWRCAAACAWRLRPFRSASCNSPHSACAAGRRPHHLPGSCCPLPRCQSRPAHQRCCPPCFRAQAQPAVPWCAAAILQLRAPRRCGCPAGGRPAQPACIAPTTALKRRHAALKTGD